jgi:hypothetical protein
LYKDSLTCTKWAVEKYEIPGTTLAGNFFTEGSHLFDI